MKLHKGQQEVYDEFKKHGHITSFQPVRWGKSYLAVFIAVEKIADGKTIQIASIGKSDLVDKIKEELKRNKIKYKDSQIVTSETEPADVGISKDENAKFNKNCKEKLRLLPCIDEFKKIYEAEIKTEEK